MWLRNKKTKGWFELDDEQYKKFLKEKTPKEKIEQIKNSEVYDFINLESEDYGEKKLNSIFAKNISTGNIEGQLDYWTYNGEYHVERTNVLKDFRKKGVGTMLSKKLQKIVGDNDIYFDMLTPDGEKLLNKIASKKEIYKRGKGNIPYYKGRIK